MYSLVIIQPALADREQALCRHTVAVSSGQLNVRHTFTAQNACQGGTQLGNWWHRKHTGVRVIFIFTTLQCVFKIKFVKINEKYFQS